MIATLVNDEGNVELVENEAAISVEIPFEDQDLSETKETKEENTSVIISFIAKAYVEEDKNNVIVELIKSNDTDYFTMKKFINYLNKKIC